MPQLVIERIVINESLTVPEREDRVAEALRRLPGLGADEAARTIAEGGELAVAYAAAYLAVLPGHLDTKRRSVQHVLRHRPDLVDDLSPLVRFLDRATADEVVRRGLEDPDAFENALVEAAEAFPDLLRAHRDKVEGTSLEPAMWPGAPGDWLERGVRAWRETRDVVVLERLSFIRTDEARTALRGLRDEVPPDDADLYETLVENAGVDPDTGRPSVYPSTLMGLVGDRDASPHHLGAGYGRPVPVCPMCDRPAARLLTLARDALPFPVRAAADPSLFWFPCDCEALEYLHARVTPDGVEGVMTQVGTPDDDRDWLPGRLAAELADHPNQHGMATDALPGFSAHQVGGYPPWVETDRFPACGVCGQSTRFLACVDSGLTAFGRMPFDGILYGFWCEDCSVSVTFEQRLT